MEIGTQVKYRVSLVRKGGRCATDYRFAGYKNVSAVVIPTPARYSAAAQPAGRFWLKLNESGGGFPVGHEIAAYPNQVEAE